MIRYKVIEINQSPIGRTPRSNPSTYTGLFTEIRKLFAELPESKINYHIEFNKKLDEFESRIKELFRHLQLNSFSRLVNSPIPLKSVKPERYNSVMSGVILLLSIYSLKVI